MSLVEATVERLGAHGDGIATLEGRPLYVPYALPGERIRARVVGPRGDGRAAELVEILASSPDRVAPRCPHFGRCGGCAMQHLDEPRYHGWKRAIVAEALSRRGLDPAPVAEPIRIPAASRRRAALTALKRGGAVTVGFSERGGHRIVAIGPCPVLTPGIVALLPGLRRLMQEVMDHKQASVGVTLTDFGLDLVIDGAGTLNLKRRTRLAQFAAEAKLARVTWDGDPVAQHRPVTVTFDGVSVALPPGGFLQPSREGEAALTGVVVEAVGGARRVADLFAGCGTLGLPLARHAEVQAVEGDSAMASALAAAARQATGRRPIVVETRDLERRPLVPEELARFDVVVVDPPFAGAALQARMLAQSRVPLVLAVSCNPATFARDARYLVDGGYRLERVQPIDQFLWSAEIEVAAVFRR
jgi:23S rRNA (uracil1939-C5)-methyltransferase